MTDWDWFFSSEYGRDKMLRNRIDDLQQASASSSRTSSRLSSQLATLQGSIETRLEALSAAFDAYVELGDVREQLTAFAENADIRRDVLEVVERLATGRDVAAVDDRDTGYWLPYATNAVIALAEGRTDPVAEERARGLSPDTGLFVVAVLSATGRGAVVADRVPDLLTTDGRLRAPQIAIWEAVAAGVYGPEVRAEVGQRWASILAAGDVAGWRDWIDARAEHPTDPAERLTWTGRLASGDLSLPLVAPPQTPITAAAAVAQVQLRAVLAAIIDEGAPNEADLLRQARELRAKIEEPDPRQSRAAGPETRPEGAPADSRVEMTQSVLDVVRRMISTTAEPALHRELLGWVADGLSAAVQVLGADFDAPSSELEVRTAGGSGVVGPSGLEPGRLAVLEQTIAEAHPDGRQQVKIWTLLSGVGIVLAVVAGLFDNVGLAAVLAIAAAAAAVVTLKQVVDRRQSARGRAEDIETMRTKIQRATEEAQALETSGRERTAQIGRLTRETCAALDSLRTAM